MLPRLSHLCQPRKSRTLLDRWSLGDDRSGGLNQVGGPEAGLGQLLGRRPLLRYDSDIVKPDQETIRQAAPGLGPNTLKTHWM